MRAIAKLPVWLWQATLIGLVWILCVLIVACDRPLLSAVPPERIDSEELEIKIGSDGNTATVMRFQDGKTTCYLLQGYTAQEALAGISCVREP